MSNDKIEYEVDGKTFEAHVEWDDGISSARPAVVIAHAWAGQTDNERTWAKEMTKLGYAGVALDVYGKGVTGSSTEENQKLMMPLVEDRDALLARLSAGLDAAKEHAVVDAEKVAAIGFCFGGLCVLDMARAGLGVRGVASVHGLFMPRPTKAEKIAAKVLACHGWDDPMVKPDAVVGFVEEMTEAGADFQIIGFGHAKHAFTNPDANDAEMGTVYSKKADERTRAYLPTFLKECLGA